MNNYSSGLQQYKEQSITTMTSGEMLVLLYDEAIKRLNKAKLCLNNQMYDEFGQAVTRVKEIMAYLKSTLDSSYPISKEILRLYDFISFDLARLEASRKPEIVDEIIPFFKDFRDTFREADKLSKQQPKAASMTHGGKA